MGLFHDVVIGEGRLGNSATLVLELPGKAHVAQNTVSYWIPDLYLGISLSIFKDTEEGKTLTTMLKVGVSADDVLGWLELVLLENAPAPLLCSAIGKALAHAKEEGREEKAKEMRKVLGL